MKKLLSAPGLTQNPQWPTGCESVTAVMLLGALGIELTVAEWVDQAIQCRPFFLRGGQPFGPDPRLCFAGRPEDPQGMGCYPPVLVAGLDRYLAGSGLHAVDATGLPMARLLQSIDAGFPVAFWATIGLQPAYLGPRWFLETTGEEFTWISNEHCMLLVGYDEDSYWFQDPLHGPEPVAYPRELTEQRHREQQSMAVLVERLEGGRR